VDHDQRDADYQSDGQEMMAQNFRGRRPQGALGDIEPSVDVSRRTAMGLIFGATCVMPSSHTAADDTFRREVLATLARLRPQLVVQPRSEPNILLVSNRVEVSLDNLQRNLDKTSDPAKRETAIVAFIEQATLQGTKDSAVVPFAEIKAKLYAHLAPSEYLAHTSGALIHREFPSKTLVAAIAIDGANTLEVVQQKHLDGWGIGADAVHAAALQNLENFAATIPLNARPSKNGIGTYCTIDATRHTLPNGNTFGSAAALVLAPRFMSRLRASVHESVFVGIPNRSFLVAWSADFDLRKEFYKQVRHDFERQAHPVSPELFVSSAAGLRLAMAQERTDHGVG
jgi:hypothetical protein